MMSFNTETGVGCVVMANTWHAGLHHDMLTTVLNAASRHLDGSVEGAGATGAGGSVVVQPSARGGV